MASGGRGGRGLIFTGEGRGGREGGFSSAGETDFTVFTEAHEEIESLLEVMLIFEGLLGDFLVFRSSIEVLILLFSLDAIALT